jgi:hypothetical protein
MYSNYKIAVHITFFLGKNYLNRINFLRKIIDCYKKISKNLDIFIHINKKLPNKNKINDVNYILHNLSLEDPHFLSWKARKLIYEQKDIYDVFIYSEDDILFTKKNFDYWIKFKDICIKNNFNLGFIRFERNNDKIYSIDVTTKLNKYLIIDNNRFVVNDVNPYCAFWIYDRQELSKFIKSNIWNFNWRNEFIYGVREMSAIGWHGLKMTRYKDTLIPLAKSNKKKYIVNLDSLIYHLTGNYYSVHKLEGKKSRINNLVDENQLKYNNTYKNYYFFKLKFKNNYYIYLMSNFFKKVKKFLII